MKESRSSHPYDHTKAELGGNSVAAIPGNPTISRKPAPSVVGQRPVSPIEYEKSDYSKPASEMPSVPAVYRAEVHGESDIPEMPDDRQYHEMYGSQQHAMQVYRPTAAMNEGPFYEMDGRGCRS